MPPKETPAIKDIKAEAKENTPQQDFEKNLNTIKSIVDKTDDTQDGAQKLEDANKISNMLDCNFEDGLKKLQGTEKGKEEIKKIYESTTAIINKDFKDKPENDHGKVAMSQLQAFLLPLVSDVSGGIKVIKDAPTEKYNAAGGKGQKSLDAFRSEMIYGKYKDLPGADVIQATLNNPSLGNIQELQKLLLDKTTDPQQRLDLYTSSWKNAKGSKEVPVKVGTLPDGKFGEKTRGALQSYLDSFSKSYQEAISKNNQTITNVENTREEDKKKEVTTDKKAVENLDKAQLAGVLSSEEVAKLTDTTLKIDGDSVVYRGEKISFTDLGIAQYTDAPTPKNFVGLSNKIQTFPQTVTKQETNKNIILSYLKGELTSNTGSFGINGKSSEMIMKDLTAKKAEIDARVNEKLKNSVTYNDKTNTYQYKGKEVSRDAVGTGQGKIDLENFKNTIDMQQDKAGIQKDNADRTVTHQTAISADNSTMVTRTVKDYEGNNGQKIIVEKHTKDGVTKTVDAQRGDKVKLVTTEKDNGGNTIHTTKVKETKDSFKEKTDNRDMALKTTPDKGNEFVPASAQDVVTVLQSADAFKADYTIGRDLSGRINISLKEGAKQQDQEKFLSNFSTALKDGKIANLDMQDYKFKGEISKDGKQTKLVDKLVFDVGAKTQKEQLTPVKEQADAKLNVAGKVAAKVAESALNAAAKGAEAGVANINVAGDALKNTQPASINLTTPQSIVNTVVSDKVTYANSTLTVPKATGTQENATTQANTNQQEKKPPLMQRI